MRTWARRGVAAAAATMLAGTALSLAPAAGATTEPEPTEPEPTEPEPGTISIAVLPVTSGFERLTFEFSGDLGDFTLTDGGLHEPDDLAPGTYRITQTVLDGWGLEIHCGIGDTSVAGNTVTINLQPGEFVGCDFGNLPPPSITLTKAVFGASAPVGDDTFEFSGDLGEFAITTTQGSATMTFENLAPGTYRVTEHERAGWEHLGTSCSDIGPPSHEGLTLTIELSTRSVHCESVSIDEQSAAGADPPATDPPATGPTGTLPATGATTAIPLALVALAAAVAGLVLVVAAGRRRITNTVTEP